MNKTKFFSSLLVAVLFATTSVFVSCKDYDDDIKNLQSQIDKAALKADLDALSTKLAGVESTANAAKTTAENALAKANANATEIAAVKATAEKAAKDAAEGLAAVAKAQTTAEAAQAAADGAKTLAENAQAAADAAQATANAAQAAADAAQATANAAATKQELADAVEKLNKAVKDLEAAAATKTELADAKTELKAYTDAAKAAALETAQAAATAAGKALTDAKDYTDAEAAKIKESIEKLATQTALETLSTELKGEIEGLKTTLAGITGVEEMEELVDIIGNFDTIVETLFRAVTSVELIASYSGGLDDANEDIQFPLGTLINDKKYGQLNFVFGKQQWTDKFGDKEDRFADADQIIEYTQGVDIRAKQAILVRVNPVNATFAKEDVKLIDSKGRNLDELVVIGDPYRFEGLITATRGTTTETGLWVIPVSVKENTQLKDFNVVTFNEREYYATKEDAEKDKKDFEIDPVKGKEGDAILYAVAINNTADEAEDRFVASTYDLSAEYIYFTPEDVLNFNLEAKDSKGKAYYATSGYENNWDAEGIGLVHNRWDDGTNIDKYTNEGKKPGILSKDQTNAYTLLNPEQAWVANKKLSEDAKAAGYVTPASVAKKSMNDDDKVYDTQNDESDYRYKAPFFTIESVGQKITVSLPEDLQEKAEYWYITYDFKANAVESNPSEWEAWQSYKSEIKGIYTMTRGAEDIDLVINKAEAQGDVIGFRVFAVNYDGSLIDPDGKAFYVKVGEEPEAQKLDAKATFMAVNANQGMNISYLNGKKTDEDYNAKKGYNVSVVTPISGNEFESLALTKNSGEATVNKEGKTNGDVTIYWALLDKDNKLATNWKDIVAVKVGVAGSDLGKIADNAGDLFVDFAEDTRADANNKEKYRINIYAKKQLPDAAWTTENHYKDKFDWKSDYNPTTGELTVYPKARKSGYFNPAIVSGKFYWNNAEKLSKGYASISWTEVANSAQRMINDYLSSTTLSDDELANYQFKLKGMPTTLETPADTVYTTDWRTANTTSEIAGNTMMTVAPAAIDHSYNVDMNYTYKAISASYDSSKKTWKTNQDYPVAINSFKKVTFKDAMELNTFDTKYNALSYYVDGNGNVIKKTTGGNNPNVTSATKVTKQDENLYIAWDSDVKSVTVLTQQVSKLYKAKMVEYDYNNHLPETDFDPATYEPTVPADFVQVGANLTGVLVTTTKDGDAARVLMRDAGITENLNAPEFTPAWFMFQKNNDGVLSAGALKFEITGDAATYIKVAEGATFQEFAFVRTGYNNFANPTEDISGKIKISGNDVFGKPHTFWIPFIIKHNLNIN